MRQLLKSSCEELGVVLSEDQIDKFIKYKEVMLEWNEKINLTAITDEREIILKHFVDCLSILSVYKPKKNIKVIDVGTGAGFPGVPLKIACPDMKMTLMDSLNKRIIFLEQVKKDLALSDTNCVHSRAEDGGIDKKYREQFDLCASRAVAHLAVLSEYCLPFVKVGGFFVALKGSEIETELSESKNAIKELGGKVQEVKIIDIPNTDIKHSLVVIKKVQHTSSRYPRKAGTAVKSPIK